MSTQGTVAFYIVKAAYMLIHHSQYFDILQRIIRFAGFVNMFLAHWRCWVFKTRGLTLGKNFLTHECYSDMVESCHEEVLQAIVFERFCPSLPLTLVFSGSNTWHHASGRTAAKEALDA